MTTGSCCSPAGDHRDPLPPVDGSTAKAPEIPATLVTVPGGRFRMGDESVWAYPGDGEGPVHDVELGPFRIAAHAVAAAEFGVFVAATGYRTDAERYGWSFVFAGLLPDDFPPTAGVADAPWWRRVEGADWQHPEGPESGIGSRGDHPVVHVSWRDAQSYCAWAGARLATEAEWEHGARGGTTTAFPWGNDLEPGGEHRMNVFQGTFPGGGTAADGFAGTAPVDAFPPNGFGLYNVTGNVWEWCQDWFDPGYYVSSPIRDPRGPDRSDRRVLRGGSYLCHLSYCRRYRVSARYSNEPDSSSGNIGFRIAADGN